MTFITLLVLYQNKTKNLLDINSAMEFTLFLNYIGWKVYFHFKFGKHCEHTGKDTISPMTLNNHYYIGHFVKSNLWLTLFRLHFHTWVC